MAILLTESAAERVRSYLLKRGHGVGLRVGVRKTGCSGWAYVIDYADSIDSADVVFEDMQESHNGLYGNHVGSAKDQ